MMFSSRLMLLLMLLLMVLMLFTIDDCGIIRLGVDIEIGGINHVVKRKMIGSM